MTTLAEIKTRQTELATMIAALEAKAPRTLHFPENSLQLAEGEHYAGIIIGKDGEASHHLILLPGEAENIPFADADTWATLQGGALPTRREQALLYANLKEQFAQAWYWSGERHASGSDYAWDQSFNDGHQNSSPPATSSVPAPSADQPFNPLTL